MAKVHKIVVERVKKPQSHHCTECSKSFASNDGLMTHCRNVHGLKRVPKKETVKCSIETCDFRCCAMQELVDHLNQHHEQGLEFEYIKFANEADFEKWKIRIERETPCRFNKGKRQRKKRGFMQNRTYYYCSRSGRTKVKPVEERKRHVKIQGSNKIDRTCAAHFVKNLKSDDTIEVKYLGKHYCYTSHIKQLGHLRLQESDRKWLAGKLAQKIPMEVILQDVRSSLNGRLGRAHIVTKQDLRNIQKSFPLDEAAERFYSDAADDAASDPPYIDEASPIVLQKQQGTTTALANTLSEEELDKIVTLCKGKYSKKLKQLRSRHANSLVQAMLTTETIPYHEWLVQDDVLYTVNRVKESCEACGLFCHECKACIHEYTCTCAVYSKYFNMCEHIHLICTKYNLSKPTEILENHDDEYL